MSFSISEGRNLNLFFQDERINVHVLWRTKPPHRLLFCFPEGNSGVGVNLIGQLQPKEMVTSWGEPDSERGAEVSFQVWGDLSVGEVCADTLRSLRDWKHPEAHGHRQELRLQAGWTPPHWNLSGDHKVELRTVGLSGRWVYPLTFEFPPGVKWITTAEGGILQGPPAPWLLKVRAGHRHPRLTPLGEDRILSRGAQSFCDRLPPGTKKASMAIALRNLGFLTYQEKLVAGSWQFLTYFGRDTLITSLLLGKTASMAFHEAALSSVLTRMSPAGQVAHEEDIGEQAYYRGGTGEDVYDYKMVDDDFLLLPAIAAAAHHPEVDQAWWADFSQRWKLQIDANVDWCLSRLGNLVGLDHKVVGDWRDSTWGLGGGFYPNSVNVGLVPPFVKALEWYRLSTTKEVRLAELWHQVPAMFRVHLSPQDLRERLGVYLATVPESTEEGDWLRRRILAPGVSLVQWMEGHGAVKALESGLVFSALSLDRDGERIEVLHSDLAFRLFLDDLPELELSEILTLLELPYPLGLAHPVGFLTANPILSNRPDLWQKLGRHGYHGSVVWSWQDAMVALGLHRQLRRPELSPVLRDRLVALRYKAREQRLNAGSLVSSELWTWTVVEGEARPLAFGAESGHETESNAIQLWSSATLALAYDETD